MITLNKTVRFKFNSGAGAIVCNRCNKIIKEPATEEDLKTTRCEFCSNIKPRLEK